MATNQLYSLGNDVWFVFGEFTLTAAGAVVPNADGTTTTDPLISVARTGAGTYLVTIPGNFQKTTLADCYIRPSAGPTSQVAEVGAISLGGGAVSASGESSTTVVITTGNSNAVPAAADQANGIVGFDLRFQKHKI